MRTHQLHDGTPSGGKSFGLCLDGKEFDRIRNTMHTANLKQSIANTEGWRNSSAAKNTSNGWLSATKHFSQLRLRISASLNTHQVSCPSGRRISCRVLLCKFLSLTCNKIEGKTLKPLVLVSCSRVLLAKIDQLPLALSGTFDTRKHLGFSKLNSDARNASAMSRNAGLRINGPTNLDMSIAEQAYINGFHLLAPFFALTSRGEINPFAKFIRGELPTSQCGQAKSALGGDLSFPGLPVVDKGQRNTDGLGDLAGTASFFDCFFDLVHVDLNSTCVELHRQLCFHKFFYNW